VTPQWPVPNEGELSDGVERVTDTPPGQGGRWRRWRRLAVGAVAALVALVVVGHVGGGWYFASVLNDRALSAERRREALVPHYSVEVRAVTAGTVSLRKLGDERLARNGRFGLVWDGGWGIIGDVLQEDSDGTVVRQFEHVGGEALQAGAPAALDPAVYAGDPLVGLGIDFKHILFDGEPGEFPAWFVPGTSSTWFILVHGNGMTPRDGLRILPTPVSAGLPTLVVTYRGSEGAPKAPDDRLTYGKQEWHDLEAAVQYALDHGARSVVLEGMSMGGAVVVAFLLESPLASRASGVILDAPMLDLARTVEHQAANESVPLVGLPPPGSLVRVVEWLARVRFGVDWGYTNYLSRAKELATPILLIHGTRDDSVPLATSMDLARLRPDLVRDFYTVEGAGHLEAWNLDPGEYERRLRAFLGAVVPAE